MNLQPHQQRVVDEQAELGKKLEALCAFMAGQVFAALPTKDQVLMQCQCVYMREYFNVLGQRIERFMP